ncbi:MAG TPA: DUF4350 domain-containing protein [Euzebyales bacterium]|nr:DUF4350 domain-containing protein [Euzebyales bacterium]
MTAPSSSFDGTRAHGAPTPGGSVDDRVLGRWLWGRLRSSWPLLVAAAAIVVAAALTAVRPDETLPLSPDSREPDGTAALVDVLAALGRRARVVTPHAIGDADVVLVLQDHFGDGAAGDDLRYALRARARAGARVVVADPGSPLTPDVVGGIGLLDRTLRRGCAVQALRDVGDIRPGDGALYEADGDAVGCFTTDGGSWLVVTPEGRGHVVALGGPGALTNAGLQSADNAMLAIQLLTPEGGGGPAIVRPLPPTQAAGADALELWELVPSGVRVMALQLCVAFGVYAMWRARRLGRALVDDTPVRLASSDLTTAVGALHARNATRADAVRRIADDTRARLARRFGLARTADVAEVAAAVAARTRRDPATVAAVLAPPDPVGDADMLAMTGALAELEQTVRTTLSPIPEPVDVH